MATIWMQPGFRVAEQIPAPLFGGRSGDRAAQDRQ